MPILFLKVLELTGGFYNKDLNPTSGTTFDLFSSKKDCNTLFWACGSLVTLGSIGG